MLFSSKLLVKPTSSMSRTVVLTTALAVVTGLSKLFAQQPDISQLRPQATIVNDSVSTVKVLEYSWSGITLPVVGGTSERVIQHTVKYESLIQNRPVAAIEFGFILINAWNEFVAWNVGAKVEPLTFGRSKQFVANSRPGSYHAAQMFSAFVFVSRIRWADGEIWESDLTSVRAAVAKHYHVELPEAPESALEATPL